MTKGGWVYIMANRYRGGMYIGVTADVLARVCQHREGAGRAMSGTSARPGLSMSSAMTRSSKQSSAKSWSKNWRREWKFALIEAEKPDWEYLWERWFSPEPPQN